MRHQRLVEACWLLGTFALGDWMIGPYLKARAFFQPSSFILARGRRGGVAAGPKPFRLDLDKRLQSNQDTQKSGDIVVIVP